MRCLPVIVLALLLSAPWVACSAGGFGPDAEALCAAFAGATVVEDGDGYRICRPQGVCYRARQTARGYQVTDKDGRLCASLLRTPYGFRIPFAEGVEARILRKTRDGYVVVSARGHTRRIRLAQASGSVMRAAP